MINPPPPSRDDWLLNAVWAIHQTLGHIVTQTNDFQGDLDALTTAVTEMRTAVDLQLQQQQDLLAQLNTRNPPTEAQLQQFRATVTKIQGATAVLGTDDQPGPNV